MIKTLCPSCDAALQQYYVLSNNICITLNQDLSINVNKKINLPLQLAEIKSDHDKIESKSKIRSVCHNLNSILLSSRCDSFSKPFTFIGIHSTQRCILWSTFKFEKLFIICSHAIPLHPGKMISDRYVPYWEKGDGTQGQSYRCIWWSASQLYVLQEQIRGTYKLSQALIYSFN